MEQEYRKRIPRAYPLRSYWLISSPVVSQDRQALAAAQRKERTRKYEGENGGLNRGPLLIYDKPPFESQQNFNNSGGGGRGGGVN
jgi:hypothetical protein